MISIIYPQDTHFRIAQEFFNKNNVSNKTRLEPSQIHKNTETIKLKCMLKNKRSNEIDEMSRFVAHNFYFHYWDNIIECYTELFNSISIENNNNNQVEDKFDILYMSCLASIQLINMI